MLFDSFRQTFPWDWLVPFKADPFPFSSARSQTLRPSSLRTLLRIRSSLCPRLIPICFCFVVRWACTPYSPCEAYPGASLFPSHMENLTDNNLTFSVTPAMNSPERKVISVPEPIRCHLPSSDSTSYDSYNNYGCQGQGAAYSPSCLDASCTARCFE